jgi:two-component system chemotaxis response regulator CheB
MAASGHMWTPLSQTSADADRSVGATPPYGIIAIAASAGGFKALVELLCALREDFPVPLLIVQHLSRHAASRLPFLLGLRTGRSVKWAEAGETIAPGVVYIAPASQHLTIAPNGQLQLTSSAHVNHCRPAADPLFESVAQTFGTRAISIVLSGMMSDGARGTDMIRRHGGLTFAQDEGTSEFFDMPGAAIDLGRADIVLPPRKIAEALNVLA